MDEGIVINGINDINNKNNNRNNNKNIEVSIDFIKNVRNLLEVTNDRIKWKSTELLPVGIMIKQLDDLLKNN
tara:strand:+ start:341 stop:556 length:216 start_codon:yes stop_codon:yes gene_type:complete